MTTQDGGRQIRVDEGGGGGDERTLVASQNASNNARESRLQRRHHNDSKKNNEQHFSDGDDEGEEEDDEEEEEEDDNDQYEQAMDIFHVKHHFNDEQQKQNRVKIRERRPSLPSEEIELATFSGVVMRRKQQLQMHFEQQAQASSGPAKIKNSEEEEEKQQQHLMPMKVGKNNRPLSISSISSSGSSVSTNSSSSSGIHSSLTRNSSLNYSQDFKANYSYLESVESLANNGCSEKKQQETDNKSSIIEEALRSLELSGKDNNLAQTRAAILAAGQLQRRSVNMLQQPATASGESKLSRINRSFHASLRYDKSTAYRIHLVANARAFGLGGQTKSYDLANQSGEQSTQSASGSACEPRGIFRRYSSSVSRNNSSISSDSGHALARCQCGATPPSALNRRFSRSSGSQATGAAAAAAASATESPQPTTTNKAATLDGRLFSGPNYQHQSVGCPFHSPGSGAQFGSCAQRPLRASPKLQQSPSSVSSYSNTSSLFRDDGFEDDLTSTASERSSSIASSGQKSNYQLHLLQSSSARQQQELAQLDNKVLCNINSSNNNNSHQANNFHHNRHRIHNEQELPLLTICQRVVTEIIETERSYVDDLEQIVSGYLCRLRDSLELHDELFSNLEDIYKFNKDFLFQLEECYLNAGNIAACFLENAEKFSVYTQYCTQYPQVVKTLTQLMAQPTSAQLLKERQLELNQSLPLGAYLLKPVQRILKYHILFKSLIKHAADDKTVGAKDLEAIDEAISVMTNIASHINEMKKRHEHSIRVQELQSLLCGWEGPDLTTLGELILEDTFRLFNRPKSSRHLLLFDNVLLITKKKHDGSLQYKSHIACTNLMLIETIDDHPLVFNTVPFNNPKALCSFQANNLEKKRDWCLQMKEVIIKSFEVKIPVHVKDLLMSLTKTNATTKADSKAASNPKKGSSEKALRAPDYLEKKRSKQQDKLNHGNKTMAKR